MPIVTLLAAWSGVDGGVTGGLLTHGDILPGTSTDGAQTAVVQSVHDCLDAALWK